MNKKLINIALAGVFFVGVSTPKLSLLFGKKEDKIQDRVEQNNQIGNPDVGVQQNVKDRIRTFTGTRAGIRQGKIVAIDGEALTVVEGSMTYTVLTDSLTKFRRKFFGDSSLSEVSVNDLVSVVGKWQNEEKTQIRAMIFRNISVQKRYGVFFGVVTSMSDNGFIIESAQRGDQTVSVVNTTTIVDRVMAKISLSNVEVGHRVRVKGTWDSVNSTITDVIQVKDFSIPILPSPTPSEE